MGYHNLQFQKKITLTGFASGSKPQNFTGAWGLCGPVWAWPWENHSHLFRSLYLLRCFGVSLSSTEEAISFSEVNVWKEQAWRKERRVYRYFLQRYGLSTGFSETFFLPTALRSGVLHTGVTPQVLREYNGGRRMSRISACRGPVVKSVLLKSPVASIRSLLTWGDLPEQNSRSPWCPHPFFPHSYWLIVGGWLGLGAGLPQLRRVPVLSKFILLVISPADVLKLILGRQMQ